jgi:hypothetical protein
MKTSIFNMNFTLPPMLEMTKVEKEMPTATGWTLHAARRAWPCVVCI